MRVFLQCHSASFRGYLTEGRVSLPVSFRYSSGILPVCGSFDMFRVAPCLACGIKAADKGPGPESEIGPGASNCFNASKTFRSASGLTCLRAHCRFAGLGGSPRRSSRGPPQSMLTEAYREFSEGPLTEVMFSSGTLPIFFRYSSGMRVKLTAPSLGMRRVKGKWGIG